MFNNIKKNTVKQTPKQEAKTKSNKNIQKGEENMKRKQSKIDRAAIMKEIVAKIQREKALEDRILEEQKVLDRMQEEAIEIVRDIYGNIDVDALIKEAMEEEMPETIRNFLSGRAIVNVVRHSYEPDEDDDCCDDCDCDYGDEDSDEDYDDEECDCQYRYGYDGEHDCGVEFDDRYENTSSYREKHLELVLPEEKTDNIYVLYILNDNIEEGKLIADPYVGRDFKIAMRTTIKEILCDYEEDIAMINQQGYDYVILAPSDKELKDMLRKGSNYISNVQVAYEGLSAYQNAMRNIGRGFNASHVNDADAAKAVAGAAALLKINPDDNYHA